MLAHFIIKLQKHAGEEGKHPLNLNMMGEGPHFFNTIEDREQSRVHILGPFEGQYCWATRL
jgi:hypothetical protein